MKNRINICFVLLSLFDVGYEITFRMIKWNDFRV